LRDVTFGKLLYQPMLTIGITQPVNADEEQRAEQQNYTQAHEHIYTTDIEHCENDQQDDNAYTQVANVLCLETSKFYRLVNAFVDFIYTVHGNVF
jgi:hypothetical protein